MKAAHSRKLTPWLMIVASAAPLAPAPIFTTNSKSSRIFSTAAKLMK